MSPWFYLITLVEVPVLLLAAYWGGWLFYVLIAFVALNSTRRRWPGAAGRMSGSDTCAGCCSWPPRSSAQSCTPGR